MLPIVALFRDLSAAKTYGAIVQKAVALGLEQLDLKVPVRRDVMKLEKQSMFKRDKTTAHVFTSTSSERGLKLRGLALSVADSAADLEQVVMEISELLGAKPEYPARDAQFAFLENDAGRTQLPLKQTSSWRDAPVGSLVHVNVSASVSAAGKNAGAMISRIETTAA